MKYLLVARVWLLFLLLNALLSDGVDLTARVSATVSSVFPFVSALTLSAITPRLVIVFAVFSGPLFLERGLLADCSPLANRRPQLCDPPAFLLALPVEFYERLLFRAYALEKACLCFKYC